MDEKEQDECLFNVNIYLKDDGALILELLTKKTKVISSINIKIQNILYS